MQCAELSRLRHQPTGSGTRPRGLTAILLAIPAATLAVAASGGMVLRSGAHTGPWVGGGVFAAVVIFTTSIWALRTLRTPNGRSAPRRATSSRPTPAQVTAIAVAQWGAPAFALAGTYLMAARPEEAAGAILPVVLALVITAAATGNARRTPPTPI
ncbi:hypothetical protein [Yinghuangia sp. YIM S09857]|uniref:hypothetical protein n=1 Tax=Yinghuangia sp. YIM S09857 TaxID=3436929 RepID=UPI003F531091